MNERMNRRNVSSLLEHRLGALELRIEQLESDARLTRSSRGQQDDMPLDALRARRRELRRRLDQVVAARGSEWHDAARRFEATWARLAATLGRGYAAR